MSLSNWIRRGGLAALLGGLLFPVTSTLENLVENHAAFHAINAPPYALLAVGTVGLYIGQAGRFGRFGKFGFFLTVTGFILVAVGLPVVAIEVAGGTVPALLEGIVHTAPFLVLLGSVLFGVAMLRAQTLSGGGASLIVAGSLAYLFLALAGVENLWLLTAPAYAFGAGWALLGYSLLSRQDDLAPKATPDGPTPQAVRGG